MFRQILIPDYFFFDQIVPDLNQETVLSKRSSCLASCSDNFKHRYTEKFGILLNEAKC